jgi:CRP/FNR family transcriptional regulator
MPDPSHPDQLFDQLRANPFFKGLGDETLAHLARSVLWREYAAGEVIFLEGEASPGLYYVQSGWLKVVKTSLEGREQVLRFVGPGEALNAVAVFTGQPNPATGIALEPSGLWLLRREVIVDLLRREPEIAQRVIENIAGRVIDLVALVEDLSLRTVTGRLARLLLESATGDVLHRPRWYTQAELAARLGTVPDVVQRALSGLAADGMIEVERHLIRIRDRAALEKLTA